MRHSQELLFRPGGALMGSRHDLNQRLYVLARPGEPVTAELLAAYTSLLYFAANVTDVPVQELCLRDLVRWLQRTSRE